MYVSHMIYKTYISHDNIKCMLGHMIYKAYVSQYL